ncbi:MAG: bifunctional oligoribonuclease/PAP phosphatase NrnA [Clostridia bacterium]|nr:bifunctional oligoribonuclease/PAP phosphatase NrnA [Clostridia bacterium]
MFERILQAIEAHRTIILHRHHSPDGDALGSQIGLKHIILENWPDKRVYMVGDAAGRYAFMRDSVMDEVPDSAYADALAIVLDTSAKALISDGRYVLAQETARIDHHIFVEKIAEHEVTDTRYESCCGLVTQFAVESGLRVPQLAAESLFTGMVTDSGRFRYDATTAQTFRLAAFLMEQPIDTNALYRNLYASDLSQVKLKAHFVNKIQLTPHGAAYIYTTLEEMKALGADIFSISRGMVGVMADIKGVDIWVNFTETPEGVACELRSDDQNINPIAVKYGGGGHAKASGATVPDRETALRMLADLDEMAGAAHA